MLLLCLLCLAYPAVTLPLFYWSLFIISFAAKFILVVRQIFNAFDIRTDVVEIIYGDEGFYGGA